jgi:hypothetical protein
LVTRDGFQPVRDRLMQSHASCGPNPVVYRLLVQGVDERVLRRACAARQCTDVGGAQELSLAGELFTLFLNLRKRHF